MNTNQLTKEQFQQFQLAIQHNVDPNILTPDLSAAQMREKRIAAEEGLDLSYFTRDVSAEKMSSLRALMKLDVEIEEAFINVYDENQLKEIKLGKQYGLDTKKYQYPYLSSDQMRSVRLKLLSEKLIQYIRSQAVSILHRVEDKIISKPLKASNLPEQNPDEKLKAAFVSFLKTMDIDGNLSIQELTEKLETEITKSDTIDISEEILEDPVTSEPKIVLDENQNIEVLDQYNLSEDQKFALLKFNDNDFGIVNYFQIDQNNTITYKECEHYSSIIQSTKEYQELIISAEAYKRNLNDPSIFENLSMPEFVILNMTDTTTAERVSLIESDNSIRPALLEIIANTDNEDPEVQAAAKAKLTEIKKSEDKDLDTAKNIETKPSHLSYLADHSKNPEVLKTVLENPNCPTSVMHLLKNSENKEIAETAENALIKRKDMKNVEAKICNNQIINTFDSKELDKNKKPIELAVISLPDQNSIGLGATFVIPTKALSKINDDYSVININPQRTFDIRCKGQKGQIISGKELQTELNKNEKTLNDRLNNASVKRDTARSEATEHKRAKNDPVVDH